MTTYAGINIDEATSAGISTGYTPEEFTYYDQQTYSEVGPEYIIEKAREMQRENPDKRVMVEFYEDIEFFKKFYNTDFLVIASGYIHDEPVE